MKSNPLVSAIIITHNRKDLVVKAMESVRAQTYGNIERILVDDASDTDVREFLTQKTRELGFQYIYIEKAESKGGNHARNVGIEHASGEYIALLDDDDTWLPEKTEKQVNYLLERPDTLIVHCAKIFLHGDGTEEKRGLDNIPHGDLKEAVWERVPFTTSCIMFRRTLIGQIGMFDENLKYWQEYEFGVRACQVTEVGLIPEYLTIYLVALADKARLTNKLDGFEENAGYIREKFSALLSVSEKRNKCFDSRVYHDGLLRAHNAGDQKARKYYLKKIYETEPSFKNFVKYLLNYDGFKK